MRNEPSLSPFRAWHFEFRACFGFRISPGLSGRIMRNEPNPPIDNLQSPAPIPTRFGFPRTHPGMQLRETNPIPVGARHAVPLPRETNPILTIQIHPNSLSIKHLYQYEPDKMLRWPIHVLPLPHIHYSLNMESRGESTRRRRIAADQILAKFLHLLLHFPETFIKFCM